jgi:excisionase family DNA binding protein
VYLNLGTGLAAAIVADGRVLAGANGAAGEIGYNLRRLADVGYAGYVPLEEAVSGRALVKLLEDGKIPYDQPGRHRRLLFTDLLAYQQRQHASRRAALDQMTEDASEAGIYGGTPEDYAAALKTARKRAARPEDAS